ncbi:isoprenyl transferase [Albibacterium bauzanense]|uniref:Isoprenyl transferase n=1 Tax=Albibacterium bauzanense TaxID=653929 RepID=A0A4R1LYA8_9SPHI|nr:isoprenyl transferase [Albibacterium bauzanense]TCK83544.1 undecaprenyl diphosphate synthase [Albibacterium bauzanense]
MELKEQIDLNKLPKHVAIIMDGNGRWAKERGKLRVFGHSKGVDSVRQVVEAAVEVGIPYLTLYAFSTENWNRPKLEVVALMEILVSAINKETKTLMKNGVKLNAIGDLKHLPESCYKQLSKAIDLTSKNTSCTLTLALSYSSRQEITEATKKIVKQVCDGTLSIDQIDQDVFSNNLETVDIPDPELMIRTSGEQRISNFLLWQLAYSELYFVDKLWPDFNKNDFYESIIAYQKRERRFGLTSEQVS